MKAIKNILIVIGVVLLLILSIVVTSKIKDETLNKQKLELKNKILKNDSLIKINDKLYTKRIADTLKIIQLNKLNKELQLKLKTPKIVSVINLQPKDQTSSLDDLTIKDSIIFIKDFYPDKKNPFIEYSAEINTITKKGTGNFNMNPLNISFGIGQNTDGTYSLNTQTPDFINITSIDVQALPIQPIKKDNFGFLLGSGLGKDFNDQSFFLTLGAALRFKKVYLELQGNTNRTISTGIKFEF